jgi:hypothetical protein
MATEEISIGRYVVRRLEEQGVKVRSRIVRDVGLDLDGCSLYSESRDRFLPSSWYVDSRFIIS